MPKPTVHYAVKTRPKVDEAGRWHFSHACNTNNRWWSEREDFTVTSQHAALWATTYRYHVTCGNCRRTKAFKEKQE